MAAQIRHSGYQVTTCDNGIDALTILVLGLPVDVLVLDIGLEGTLCCAKFALEARALRPGLRILLAGDRPCERDAVADLPADAVLVARTPLDGAMVARTVRESLRGSPTLAIGH